MILRDAAREPHDPTRQSAKRRIVTWRSGKPAAVSDLLVGEEPLQIRVAGVGAVAIDVAVTMRTPGNDIELAIGFLVSEGLISPSSVSHITFGDALHDAQPENHLTVHLNTPFDATAIAVRATVATASCGICGKASIDEVAARIPPVVPLVHLSAAAIGALPDQLRAAQPLFDRTGGIHAAANVSVADSGSLELETVREDVGRHNAVDKLIGEAAQRGALPLTQHLLLLSGRCSFELVQKAGAAGFGGIVAVGAPSDLAVETAERLGICLVGFVRGSSLNVYTRAEIVSN